MWAGWVASYLQRSLSAQVKGGGGGRDAASGDYPALVMLIRRYRYGACGMHYRAIQPKLLHLQQCDENFL